jgi:filamentous hemagglutinin family protein
MFSFQAGGSHQWLRSLSLAFIGGFFFVDSDRPAWGQTLANPLIPDGTTSTVLVDLGSQNWAIRAGTVAGSNLFHSFGSFNIEKGHSVTFESAPNIANIFARVTGNSTRDTDILGTLRVAGNANFFLINPRGILFGKDAVLDMRGAFTGSTAAILDFPANANFDASIPSPDIPTYNETLDIENFDIQQARVTKGLLNVTGLDVSPQGLRFSKTDSIQVKGRDGDDGLSPSGQQLVADRGIALLGGKIQVEDRTLNVRDGSIVMTALDENSSMKLSYADGRFSFDIGENSQLLDLKLNNTTFIVQGITYQNVGDKVGNIGSALQLYGYERIRSEVKKSETPLLTAQPTADPSSSTALLTISLGPTGSKAQASPRLCASRSRGPATTLSYSGRGGLAPSPSSLVQSEFLWLDGETALAAAQPQAPAAQTQAPAQTQTPITKSAPVVLSSASIALQVPVREAGAWRLNAQKAVVLVAAESVAVPPVHCASLQAGA